MSNFHFFNNNNITRAYKDPHSILIGDISSVRNKIIAASARLEKDPNLINPKVILPFLAGANTHLDILLKEVQKGRKLEIKINSFKIQYEQLIKDLVAGLDKATFGNEDKLGKRYLDGLKMHLEWHVKLSGALIQHPGRMRRIIR